jgi:hypothetical protein
MRILQPENLQAIAVQSYWRVMRDFVLARTIFASIFGMALMLLRSAVEKETFLQATWKSLCVVAFFTLFFYAFTQWQMFISVGGRRSAEVHGDRIRLGIGPFHHKLDKSQIVSCTIDPHQDYPEFAELIIVWNAGLSYRLGFSHRHIRWKMLIPSLEEGEKFRSELGFVCHT